MDELHGKVAVVTGSASGLGRAMAEGFAREGMTAVIADRRLDDARAVAKEIEDTGARAVAIEVDVTDRDSVVALADRIDRELEGASVLVNNAGVFPLTTILEPEETGWRWIVDVNLFGVIYGLQTFVPRMLASGRECHVVNTASIAGLIAGATADGNRLIIGDRVPEAPMWHYGYSTTKAAVITLSESLRLELSGTRVGVSVLLPDAHSGGALFQNSAQFRPEKYGGPVDMAAAAAAMGRGSAPTQEEARGPDRVTKDPAELAARVIRAIREEQFYIFTHSSNRAAIEERFSQISAGFDDADSFTG
jgi:NAD(P)-dependent dehydrogenase (short-subunit alcohol dehydrogenase family)